jgi:hypothetical protein
MSTNIQEQFEKMPLGEKIILVAGPLLFIDSFLPWYDFAGGSLNAWDPPSAFASILAVFIGLAMAGIVALTRFANVTMPELPQGITMGRIYLGLGGLAGVLVLIKLADHSSSLGFGFFLGIILVGALIAGGFLMFQEEKQGGGGGGSA